MRFLLGTLLVLHAIAHLVGFTWPWWIGEPLPPYGDGGTTGALLVDDTSMRALSVVWLATAIAFGVAGVARLFGARCWRHILTGAATASLVLSVVCWPASLLGVPVNLAILAALRMTWNRKNTTARVDGRWWNPRPIVSGTLLSALRERTTLARTT